MQFVTPDAEAMLVKTELPLLFVLEWTWGVSRVSRLRSGKGLLAGRGAGSVQRYRSEVSGDSKRHIGQRMTASRQETDLRNTVSSCRDLS